MRFALFILLILLFGSCQKETNEGFLVPLDNCEYFPSPCSLITIDEYVEISGSSPWPTSESADSNPSGNFDLKFCELGFEEEFGLAFVMTIVLQCISDDDPIILSERTALGNDFPHEVDDAFAEALFYPAIRLYLFRKGNYIVDIEYQNISREQVIEVANIIYNNLP